MFAMKEICYEKILYRKTPLYCMYVHFSQNKDIIHSNGPPLGRPLIFSGYICTYIAHYHFCLHYVTEENVRISLNTKLL